LNQADAAARRAAALKNGEALGGVSAAGNRVDLNG